MIKEVIILKNATGENNRLDDNNLLQEGKLTELVVNVYVFLSSGNGSETHLRFGARLEQASALGLGSTGVWGVRGAPAPQQAPEGVPVPPHPAQTCLCLRTPAASSQHMDAAGEAADCLRLQQEV